MHRRGHMLDKVSQRLEQRTGKRVDLLLADTRDRGHGGVDLLIRYAPRHGAPTTSQIVAFINSRFDNLLEIQGAADHGQIDDRHGAVHVQASLPRTSLDFAYVESDPSSWRKMDEEGTCYLHQKTAEVWNVERDEEGIPSLFKAEQEDVESLLRAAGNDRVRTAGLHNVTFDNIHIQAGMNVYDIGDVVDYYCNGTRCRGRIANMEKNAKGECRYYVAPLEGNREPDLVPSGFMIECVEKGRAGRGEQGDRVQDFYRKVYPSKEFADRLTRGY